MLVGLVDYGMGNLRSVASALEVLGANVCISNDHNRLLSCDRLVLPGVGSFYQAMENVRELRLDVALREYVEKGKPLLGICLGMQLLASAGLEDGGTDGLGLIDGEVERFALPPTLPIPHVGFNRVTFTQNAPYIHTQIGAEADFYFVHSYRFICRREEEVIGWCTYGERFAAAVMRGNVVGVQFHPEKSQSNGLKMLNSFLNWWA